MVVESLILYNILSLLSVVADALTIVVLITLFEIEFRFLESWIERQDQKRYLRGIT